MCVANDPRLAHNLRAIVSRIARRLYANNERLLKAVRLRSPNTSADSIRFDADVMHLVGGRKLGRTPQLRGDMQPPRYSPPRRHRRHISHPRKRAQIAAQIKFPPFKPLETYIGLRRSGYTVDYMVHRYV